MNREEWLRLAAIALKPYCTGTISTVSMSDWLSSVDFSVGFPRRRQRRGQVMWDYAETSEGRINIYVSPLIDNRVLALVTVKHAIVTLYMQRLTSGRRNHRLLTERALRREGFRPPFRSVVPTPELIDSMEELATAVVPYPHDAVVQEQRARPTQTTRMLKVQCDGFFDADMQFQRHSAYIVRISRTQLDRGAPGCGVCRTPMRVFSEQDNMAPSGAV